MLTASPESNLKALYSSVPQYKYNYYSLDSIKKSIINSVESKVNSLDSDVKTLDTASKLDITFFDSLNYKELAKTTKAIACITSNELKKHLPTGCVPIVVKNVLYSLASLTKKFYPTADIDYPDKSLKTPNKSKYPKVKFGNNVLVGKNCVIGKNSYIGSNTIIKDTISAASY